MHFVKNHQHFLQIKSEEMEHHRQNRAAVKMEAEAEADSDLSCDEELDDPLAFDSGDAAQISDEGELSDDEQMEEQEDLSRAARMELAATDESAWISKDKTTRYNREPIDSHVHSFYGRYHANIESGRPKRDARLWQIAFSPIFIAFQGQIAFSSIFFVLFRPTWSCFGRTKLKIGIPTVFGANPGHNSSYDQ